MKILGLETSCDETAAAIVSDERVVLSSVIHTQIPLHAPHGGVVPEIASRSHIEKIAPVIRAAVEQAGCEFSAIDEIAVTYGPGLASSLLVGLNAAKGLAVALGKPLVAINHIQAHIHSVFLAHEVERSEVLPLLALVVSGGHTAVVEVDENYRCRVLGQTLDDAAGEAFDKASKMLGLGYPGGPAIQKAADSFFARGVSAPPTHRFPKGRIDKDNPGLGELDAELCMSFSGLKTSLRNYLEKTPDFDTGEVAAAYQEAIVGALADRCARALSRGNYKALACGGGVSLNAALRGKLREVAERFRVPLLLPEPRFCGDNAAMIAGLAATGAGIRGAEALAIDVVPSLMF